MIANVYAKELLAASGIAASSNSNAHKTIKCVYVEFNDNGYSITATDSFKLVHFTNVYARDYHDISDMNSILISAEFIKKNIKASDYIVEISTDGNYVEMRASNKKGAIRDTMRTEIGDGTFPKYKQFFEVKKPTDQANVCNFNSDFVADMCKCVNIAYGKETCINVEFYGERKPAIFKARTKFKNRSYNNDGHFIAALMPVRVS